MVPSGLYDLSEYFRLYHSIQFDNHISEDGHIVATSTNFKYGSIITSAADPKELDSKIKDAILTSFEIPSSHAQEASIQKVGERSTEYALA